MLKIFLMILSFLFFLQPANASELDVDLKKYDKVFLYLYANDCGYCVKFNPYYNKLASLYNSKNCKFIKIDAMTEEGNKIGQNFGAVGVKTETGMTMAFIVLALTESFHSLNARSINHSLFSIKKQNLWLWGAFVAAIVLSLAVVLIPGINTAFGFIVPEFKLWLIAIGLSISIIPIVEITKVITNAVTKKNR